MTDDKEPKPTGRAIKAALTRMVQQAQDGDVLYVHFSGHGTQIPTDDKAELDGLDEALCPCDMNIICDNDLRLILQPLHQKGNVKLTFTADCCHSGTLLDHAEVAITGPKTPDAPPPPKLDIQALQGMLASLGLQQRSRSLSYDQLCDVLGAGKNQLHEKLLALFGEDASVTSFLAQGFRMVKGHLDAHLPGAIQFVQGNVAGGVKNLQHMQATIQQEGAKQFVLGNLGGGVKNMQNFAAGVASAVQQHGPGAMQAAQGHMAGAVQALQGGLAGFMKNLSGKQDEGQGGGQTGEGGAAAGAAEAELEDGAEGSGVSVVLEELGDVGILLTGCQDRETSADARPPGGQAYGAFTNALVSVVNAHHNGNPSYPLTNRNLVIGVREMLGKAGFTQSPCLECAAKWADSPFLINP